MKQLSLVQKYMLWCLEDKGTIGIFNKEAQAGILVGAVIELIRNGSVQMDSQKTFRVTADLSCELDYLRPLYETIKDAQPIGIKKLTEYYMLGLTDKHINALIHTIGNKLAQLDTVQQEAKSMFSSKMYYLPKEEDVRNLVDYINNISHECVKEEDILFVKLLETSKQLKKHLSKNEIKQLKHISEKLEQTQALDMLEEMQEYMDTIFAFIAIIASV